MIVHVSRLSDGSRKVMKISEVTGMEGEMIMMQDLYEFARTDTASNGAIVGHFAATGIRSTYGRRLELAGFKPDSRLIRAAGD
jgi:pilus assembly protein CpaF